MVNNRKISTAIVATVSSLLRWTTAFLAITSTRASSNDDNSHGYGQELTQIGANLDALGLQNNTATNLPMMEFNTKTSTSTSTEENNTLQQQVMPASHQGSDAYSAIFIVNSTKNYVLLACKPIGEPCKPIRTPIDYGTEERSPPLESLASLAALITVHAIIASLMVRMLHKVQKQRQNQVQQYKNDHLQEVHIVIDIPRQKDTKKNTNDGKDLAGTAIPGVLHDSQNSDLNSPNQRATQQQEELEFQNPITFIYPPQNSPQNNFAHDSIGGSNNDVTNDGNNRSRFKIPPYPPPQPPSKTNATHPSYPTVIDNTTLLWHELRRSLAERPPVIQKLSH